MTRKIELAPGVTVVAIEGEEPDLCELCGSFNELRPYGEKLENGRRKRVCFDCAMKNKTQTDQAISELFNE